MISDPDSLDDPPRKGTRMRLHAVGGLANRLRAMLSFRNVYGPIEVLWQTDCYVSNAHFLDVFEPIEGIEFVHDGGWTVEDYGVNKEARPGWEEAYRELVPRHAARALIDKVGVGPYAAMHLRRTDMTPLLLSEGKQPESSVSFLSWAQEIPGRIFLACDNGVTQRTMMGSLGQRSFVSFALDGEEIQGLTNHRRNGPLYVAVADMFLCAKATRFRGTNGSSFSDTISVLRRLNGRS